MFVSTFIFITGSLLSASTESVLGDVKVVKISQKVSVSDCRANFVQKEILSICKIPVFELKDTDIFLASSAPVILDSQESHGFTLQARLSVNVKGYYLYTFERQNREGFTREVSLAEALPLMQELSAQAENGEVFWKLYRLQ